MKTIKSICRWIKRWTCAEFSGRIIRASGSCYYESKYKGSQFCHDFTDVFIDTRNRETPSWGYQGTGSERMAVAVLAIALAPPLTMGGTRFRQLYTGRLSDATRWEMRSIIEPAYKHFAKDVIANLPDNWVMSRRQVRKWIRDNGYDYEETTKYVKAAP